MGGPAKPIMPPYAPYVNVSAVKYFEEIVKPEMEVFEVGSGSSTVWFASQGCSVTSIEHDWQWSKEVQIALSREEVWADVKLVTLETYTDPLEDAKDDFYDIVFLDGWQYHRGICIKLGMRKVKMGGWLILDDTNWQFLRKAAERLYNSGQWDLTRIPGTKKNYKAGPPVIRGETSFLRRLA